MAFDSGFVKVGDAEINVDAVAMIQPTEEGQRVNVFLIGSQHGHRFEVAEVEELKAAIASRRFGKKG